MYAPIHYDYPWLIVAHHICVISCNQVITSLTMEFIFSCRLNRIIHMLDIFTHLQTYDLERRFEYNCSPKNLVFWIERWRRFNKIKWLSKCLNIFEKKKHKRTLSIKSSDRFSLTQRKQQMTHCLCENVGANNNSFVHFRCSNYRNNSCFRIIRCLLSSWFHIQSHTNTRKYDVSIPFLSLSRYDVECLIYCCDSVRVIWPR